MVNEVPVVPATVEGSLVAVSLVVGSSGFVVASRLVVTINVDAPRADVTLEVDSSRAVETNNDVASRAVVTITVDFSPFVAEF